MPKIRLDEGGSSTCSVYLVFTRTSTNKNKACDSLEVISEAIEVIYAFWVNAEPSEVMGAWIVALISDENGWTRTWSTRAYGIIAVLIAVSQVAVNSVVCGLETVSMAVSFQVNLSNATLASLGSNKTAPTLLESTLAPFGLMLSSSTVMKQPQV
jgi:hypothetical protein